MCLSFSIPLWWGRKSEREMLSQMRYDSSKFFCFGEQAFVKENALYIFCKDYPPPTPAARAKRRSFSALHCENLGFLEVRPTKVLASHSASNKLPSLSLKCFYQFMALVDLGWLSGVTISPDFEVAAYPET